MMTKNILRHLAWGVLWLVSHQVWSQVTIGNNNGLGGAFLGWNAGASQILDVKNEADEPIRFFTNNTQRMKLWEDRVTNNINGYTPLHYQYGFLGLSGRPGFFNMGSGPFSRLHLVDDVGTDYLATYAQQFGWRPWMRNGVSFTGNEDQGYIGQKYVYQTGQPSATIRDRSDMVLQWSNDYAGEFGPDRLRFLFTNEPGEVNGGPIESGARSTEGLEGMRLTPITDTTINVGVGDFFAGNLNTPALVDEPTERLDILTGRVRIRQLPTDPASSTLQRYLVVDDVDPTNPEFGVIKWRNLPPSATSNCEWLTNPGTFKMATSYLSAGTNGSCPDRRWMVGIGKSIPAFKLDIDHSESDGGNQGGLRINYLANTTSTTSAGATVFVGPTTAGSTVLNPTGVFGSVKSPGYSGVGVRGLVTMDVAGANVVSATGLNGRVSAEAGTATNVYGAFCEVALSNVSVPSSGLGGGSYGVYASSGGSGTIANSYGVYGRSYMNSGTANKAYGVYATSAGSSSLAAGAIGESYGVYAVSSGPASPVVIGSSFGVYAKAVNGTTNIGLYATAYSGTTNWAVWSQGDQFSSTGAAWQVSDEQLKTNIEDLEGGLDRIMQLRPKSYRFRSNEFPFLNLAQEPQFGLLAQNMEEVVPDLVRNVSRPADTDSLGSEIAPAMDFKAVKYDGLIPILVRAVQEQQAMITEQNERLDQLEQLLVECCNRPTPDGLRESTPTGIPSLNDTEGDRKLRIQPNPFSESTTVYYTLERGGRAQLMANSADGKQLRVLHEANLENGNYQYNWNTADLAAGIYYVTLFLDGQPVVKKAVKVNR